MKKNKSPSSCVVIRGFFKLQFLDEDDNLIRDTGWTKNQITDSGIHDFLVSWLCFGTAKYIKYMSLGTGSAPLSGDTVLDSEATSRVAVTGVDSSSKVAQFTGFFHSGDSLGGHPVTITNVGLFDSATGGTLFSGHTTSSPELWIDNQSVRVIYEVEFASV